MPSEQTPPNSPSVNFEMLNEDDEIDMEPLDENDVAEIWEENEESVVMTDSENDEAVEEEDKIPERDDAQLVFAEHREGVLTCEFYPKTNNIAVSGGMDDVAYVWDTTNGNTIFTCKGHEDSVEIVSFSYDGSYLATADLNGVIKVWRTKDHTLVTTFELDDELGWLQWHIGSNILVASSQIGMVYMYRIPSCETKMVIPSFGQSCLTGKILPDGRSLACGYKDGTLKIVDLKQGIVLKDVKAFDEIGGITCLDVNKSNNLIICGCTSGAVFLVHSTNGKIVSFLQNIQNLDNDSYIEAVSFCKDPSYQLAASGSLDGNLIIWDIVQQNLRYKFNFNNCINHLTWHPNLPIVFTCHFEGIVRVFDAKAGAVMKEFLGHQKNCLNMSLSKDGSLLMSTSEDKTVRIFSIDSILSVYK